MIILLKLDNMTAVTFISRIGGTHSKLLCELALALQEWCIQRNLFLVSEHLPGQQNVLADRESRNLRDRCDWMTNPQMFCSTGTLSGGPVFLSPDLATTQVLQLENRSGSGGNRWLHTGLVTPQGFFQPPLVSNSLLPQSSLFPEGQVDIINSPVAIPTMVPSSTGHVRGHTSTGTNSGRSQFLHPGQEFQMPQLQLAFIK